MLTEISKLTKDLKKAEGLTVAQGRYLVDLYYELQEHRKSLGNQVSALASTGEPNELIQHFYDNIHSLEKSIVPVMNNWVMQSEVGRWSMNQHGIGPILAAGLLVHIDIHKAPVVANIWSFAGLDPNKKWNKGEKRPWNARLKVICWKIGDSFVKSSGSEKSYYGKLYLERKEYEIQRNEDGGNADYARMTLEQKKFKDVATRQIYESGKLPQGQLLARARRWTVKLFLAHWHHVAYVAEFGKQPPAPYPIAHLGHAHIIAPPE